MNEITSIEDKAQHWQRLILEQHRSGKSVRAFCEEHHLKQYSFRYWKNKFFSLSTPGLEGRHPSRFVPISRSIPFPSRSTRIHLPNGVQIDLGGGLELGSVNQLIRSLCGVDHPPKDYHNAKY